MNEIVWKPQPKQAEFMMRGEYEALYGGAAGKIIYNVVYGRC